MIDQTTLSPFERRLVTDLDRYVSGIADPTPIAAVAGRAMASRRRGVFVTDRPWLRLTLIATLLVLALLAAVAFVGQQTSPRPLFGGWVLDIGCGADLTCPDGEAVWLSRPDGSEHRALFADQPVQMRHATWTPDGGAVIATDQHDLYLSSLDGPSKLLSACVDPCLGQDDPAVSPDGSLLAYTVSQGPIQLLGGADYTDTMQLVVASLAPDGTLGSPRVIHETHASSTSGANQIYGPRWSPDGDSLVYWEDRVDPDGTVTGAAVFTVGLADGEVKRGTDWATFAGDADWSPDGTEIVYSTHPSALARPSTAAMSDLWLLSVADGTVRRLTHEPSSAVRAMQPRYRGDGSIVYVLVKPGPPEIRILDLSTMEDEVVLSGLMRLLPEWQPPPAD